jgi:DNA polymerase-3 subunit epsilon
MTAAIPWYDAPMLALSIETTGTDVERDRAVSAALVYDHPRILPVTHDWLINPGIPIPPTATVQHGITDQHVREDGKRPAAVLGELMDVLENTWTAQVPLVVFDAPVVLGLLDRELKRTHGQRMAMFGPVLDPLLLDRMMFAERLEQRRLDVLCRLYGVQVFVTHRVLDDAGNVMALVRAQARAHPALGGCSVDELQGLQRISYADNAAREVVELERQRGVVPLSESMALVKRIARLREQADGWPLYPRPVTLKN